MSEAFAEVLDEPGGQIESVLPISQEIILPGAKPRKKKETILVRSEEIECLNLRFTTESLTSGESLLHLFALTRGAGNCEELICNHGSYKKANPKCHKVLDESDMAMLQIDLIAPLNFICEKCLDKSDMGSKLYDRKSSLKHIKGDLQANDVMICEKRLRSRATRRIKESDRGTGANGLKDAES